MGDLIRDFRIGLEDAAAIVGNGGHESGGFASLQEIKPTIDVPSAIDPSQKVEGNNVQFVSFGGDAWHLGTCPE